MHISPESPIEVEPSHEFRAPAGRLWRGPVAVLRRAMGCLSLGSLVVETPSGGRISHVASRPGPAAILVIRRWRAVRRLLTGGQIGFAEAYIDGDWTSPDLTALIELAARNQDALTEMFLGNRVFRVMSRWSHHWRANTRRGSKRNIQAHYDLGNDFYAAWLDRGMSYSSALFSRDDETLEEAQAAKQARVMRLLALQGGERVLEVGCGWGGLAARMITEHGCTVTGLTLSPAQAEYARRHLALAGAAGGSEIRLQDYRETAGVFDRIVSIEMLEAVGAEYWPEYFSQLRKCLSQGGRAVLQVITIAERYYENYLRDPDFIQRHIFPGGMLPSGSVLRAQIEANGLQLKSAEHFGKSYAATLAEWQARFQNAWPELRTMGFDEAFRRKWEYYLSYCEAGFRAGAIDVGLYELVHAR